MKKNVMTILVSLLLCCCLLTQPIASGAGNNSENTHICEVTEDLQAAMAKAGDDDLIPVYLWYEDVDHEEAESMTEAAIGYPKEEIVARAEEAATEEALNEIRSMQLSGMNDTDEINRYLDATKDIRAKEAEYTDLYIATKRNIEKNLYQAASSAIINGSNIREDRIVFNSKYAPMMIVSLTKAEIEKSSKQDEIYSLSLFKEISPENCSMLDDWDMLKETSGIDKTKSISLYNPSQNVNLNGVGVNVGIIEVNNIYLSPSYTEFPSNRFFIVGDYYCNEESNDNHANCTAKILCCEYGIANAATCFSASAPSLIEFYSGTEALVGANVSLINFSASFERNVSYTDIDKWVDHLSAQHEVTFVSSAGNKTNENGSKVKSPASAYNTIAVGAYNNMLTGNEADDVFFDYSCYEDYGGCAKPDVVAPANMFLGGTSSSAPFVSGVIALMLQARPSLAAYPEIIKAVVIASSHRQVKNSVNDSSAPSMIGGWSEKQGAGAFDPFRAVCIVCNGNYGFYLMSQNQTSSSIPIRQPQYDSTGINFSIVWPRTNTVSGNDHSTGTVTVGALQNLTLTVKNGNTVLGTSNLGNSSTEMVYTNTFPADHKFTIQVSRSTNTGNTVRYAYAWSLNKERYQHARIDEGLYYLRMEGTLLYLDVGSTHLAQLNSFASATHKLWVLNRAGASAYLQDGSAQSYRCLTFGNQIPSSTDYVAQVTTANASIYSLIQKSNGSIKISKIINGLTHLLDVKNDNATAGEQIVWAPSDMSDMHQRWFFEKYAYQRGDVNMDGQVTAEDAQLISQMVVNLITPTSAQKYLADCNGDEEILAEDAQIALQIAVGLQ